ncbi:MAG: Fic family protein [Verrucomicrobia bacterium]|nr:Fic family protein [Verrucomicrobiota bacterium]MBU6446746.1 Fic family protein [Verrucomicrobiota bacterium]MDE3047558.1 Fic family protein [Verrucomicrobiota bacterium]
MVTPVHSTSSTSVAQTDTPRSAAAPTPTADTLASAQARPCCSWISSVSSIVDWVTYPFRSVLCTLARFAVFRIVIVPLEILYNWAMHIYDSIYYVIAKRFTPAEIPLTDEQLNLMRQNYWGLGSDKWKEGVESGFHCFGSRVFDQGLHGGAIEFGFNRNWCRGVHFLSHQFQKKVDADLYLALHEIACGHFLGAANDVVSEQAGVFRNERDTLKWNCATAYTPTPQTLEDLAAMNREIEGRFGTTIAGFAQNPNQTWTLHYTSMPQEKVKSIYNYFCANMTAELERAQNADEKLTAICKFFRNTEWLHSVRDGGGRCDLMMFNFLLTQHGFHPALLNNCYLANTRSLPEWVDYVRQGLRTWEQEVAALG